MDDLLLHAKLQKKNPKLSLILSQSSKNCLICRVYKCKTASLQNVIVRNLNKKYLTTRESYNAKVINDIVYNENTHVVSVFKDYLIFDEVSEYLKRFYAKDESATRLPKIYNFYDQYSKVFPNYYAVFPENKAMFKNIERKQRVIDEGHKIAEKNKKKVEEVHESVELDKLFTTIFLKDLNKPDKTMSQYMDTFEEKEKSVSQLQSFLKNKAKKDKKSMLVPLNEMSLQKLVDKFIFKDSQSLIDVTGTIKQIDAQKSLFDESGIEAKKDSKVDDKSASPNTTKSRKESSKQPPALSAPKGSFTGGLQKSGSVTRVQSPAEHTSSRNSVPSVAGGGVWSTLKGQVTSSRASSEMHVKTIVAGNIPIIVTRRGPKTVKKQFNVDSKGALQRSKTKSPIVWNGADKSPVELEGYTHPVVTNLKGKNTGTKKGANQIPLAGDISPYRVREVSQKKMVFSNKLPNPSTHLNVIATEIRTDIYGGGKRSIPGIFSTGMGNVLLSTKSTNPKRNMVIELEGPKGSTRSSKPESKQFKSDYLNKLQTKSERNNNGIIPKIKEQDGLAGLVYSSSMGLLDHRTTGSVIHQTVSPKQGWRNNGHLAKNRRSGSYNKMQPGGRVKRA